MLISELMTKLQEILDERGDAEVRSGDGDEIDSVEWFDGHECPGESWDVSHVELS